MHDFALIVFHIEINLHMRIRPNEFRYDSPQRDWIFQVVRRVAVVGERRATQSENYDHPGKDDKPFSSFHYDEQTP
jgi:hypothetical protein